MKVVNLYVNRICEHLILEVTAYDDENSGGEIKKQKAIKLKQSCWLVPSTSICTANGACPDLQVAGGIKINL